LTGQHRIDWNIGFTILWVRKDRHQTVLHAMKEPGLDCNLCCEVVGITDLLDAVGFESIMSGGFVGSVVFGVDLIDRSCQSL